MQTNCQMIKLALTQISLAGVSNGADRESVLAELQKDANRNYIILFKPTSGRQDYRALYSFCHESHECLLVCSNGQAPALLKNEMIDNYFRYNSG